MSTATADQISEYLSSRASAYGGSVSDMLNLTPGDLWDSPNELMAYWESKDISHIQPQSLYPELANDWSNIIAEDSDVNRARGGQVMTDAELESAFVDNYMDAYDIDTEFTGDSSEFMSELLELAS